MCLSSASFLSFTAVRFILALYSNKVSRYVSSLDLSSTERRDREDEDAIGRAPCRPDTHVNRSRPGLSTPQPLAALPIAAAMPAPLLLQKEK